ncbi:MAG: ArsC/Spx/MgsR family protein [Bacteroidota bacterium]
MKKVYYLSTCTTCKKIMSSLGAALDAFDQQDIKTELITEEQLDAMKALAGDYESLFTRRSMKYRAMGLADQSLGEADYRRLILEEYTFLKRPVFVVGEEIFIGNAKKTVDALKQATQR